MKSLLPLIFVTAFALTWATSPLQTTRERGSPLVSRGTKRVRDLTFTKERLPPNNVVPEHYDLTLVPIFRDPPPTGFFNLYDCDGTVVIRVLANVAVNTIYLNVVGVVVPGLTAVQIVALVDTDTDPLAVADVETNPINEFLVITLSRDLVAGNTYSVTIQFTSTISSSADDLNGLYVSNYKDLNDVDHPVLSTQFETTGAREVFPCFDEPEFKATFQISVAYDPAGGYNTLGNQLQEGASESYADIPGWQINHFGITVPMSSYLVAILGSDYACVLATPDAGDSYTNPAQVCGPPHLVEVANDGKGGGVYPAYDSTKLLSYFQDLTGIPYHLDKMDSVYIPLFDAGAMENWGLNTYRPEIIMYYEGESTEASRLQTTSVLAHELFHQWFGNSVTCSFWDQIWLNEALVTYFQYRGVSDRRPEYLTLEWRQYDAAQYAMDFDVSSRTHPLINAAQTWGTTYQDYEIGVFDAISYEKGASLLRMMEGFLTDELFLTGLRNYLVVNEFEAVNQDALFDSLNTAGGAGLPEGVTVKDIMDTWSLQSGFPLVRVTKASNTRIYLSQERFGNLEVVYTPNKEDDINRNDLWEIPVSIATMANPDFDNHETAVWIEKNVALKSYDVDTTQWIVVNADGLGYYRVLYEPPIFDILLAQFNAGHAVISPMSRSQIIDDYFALYRHGYTEIETTLSLTTYLGGERSAVVWATATYNFEEFLNKLPGSDAYEPFKNYMVSLVGDALTGMGLPLPAAATGIEVMMRRDLYDWACLLEHTACRDYAVERFLTWTTTPAEVRVDIRPIMFCGAVARDTIHYATALTQYGTVAASSPDRLYLLNALACTEVEANLNTLLTYVLGGTTIAEEHRIQLLLRIAQHSILGRRLAIDFVQENLISLVGPAGEEAEVIVRFFNTLRVVVGTTEEITTLRGIIELPEYAPLLVAVIGDLEGHLATMQGNVEWRAEYVGRLATWFTNAIPA